MTENQQNSLLGKIAVYTEILANDPKSTIFVSLSEAYRKMGMLDDARQVVESGLEYQPEFGPAHIVLARIRCQQGDYVGSDSSFVRALELDPVSLAGLVGYARLNILLGREAQARELLLEARQQNPADPVINKLLLSLPAEPPQVKESVSVEKEQQDDSGLQVEREEQDEPAEMQTSLVSPTLADLYLKQGLEKQALQMYRQLSAQEPNNLVLRRQIRDLDEKISFPLVEEVEVPQPAGPDSSPESEDSAETISKAETVAVEDEYVIERSDSENVLDTLNQWLVNIQQRR